MEFAPGTQTGESRNLAETTSTAIDGCDRHGGTPESQLKPMASAIRPATPPRRRRVHPQTAFTGLNWTH